MPHEMQPTMLIASGDYLRGDEAVPHRVLSLLGSRTGVSMHDVPRLNPELSRQIAGAAEVVFVGPDGRLGEPWMEPVDWRTDAGRIVDAARRDFQFNGRAYLCHVPGLEFNGNRTLTAYAEARARQAAGLIRKFLGAATA